MTGKSLVVRHALRRRGAPQLASATPGASPAGPARAGPLAAALLLLGAPGAGAQVFWDAAEIVGHCSALEHIVQQDAASGPKDVQDAASCLGYVMGAYDTMIVAGRLSGEPAGVRLPRLCPTRDSTAHRLSQAVLAYLERNRASADQAPAAQSVIAALVEALPCPP
jgi:hypothetical protein